MLITITRADDHPANYILAAADDPTEQVRITPDALSDLVLMLQGVCIDDESAEHMREFGDADAARWAIENQIMVTDGFTRRDHITTEIELADWHRLCVGDRPGPSPGLLALFRNNDPIREAAQCAVCDQGFTPRQWDDRHSDSDGADVHEECCEICKANPT